MPSASLTFRVGDRELTDPGEVSAAVAGWKAGLSEGKFAHKDGKDGRFHTVVCSGCSKSGHLEKMGRTKLPGGRESHGFMCKSCGATTTVINSPGETIKSGGSEANNPMESKATVPGYPGLKKKVPGAPLAEAETRADHPESCSLPHGKMAKRGKRICPACKAPLKVEEASVACPSCGMPNTARTAGSRVGKCKHCGINYSSVVHKATIAEAQEATLEEAIRTTAQVTARFDPNRHPRGREGQFAEVLKGLAFEGGARDVLSRGRSKLRAELPSGVSVERVPTPGLYNVVDTNKNTKLVGGAKRAARLALKLHDGGGVHALAENKDKTSMAKASTPEPFSASKTSNWVARLGGLPPYIQHIAHDIAEKRGKTVSEAIRIAIGVVKNWAHGHGKVDADTKAAAAKALEQWTALKAKNAAKKVAGKLSEAEYDALLMLDGPAVVLEEAEERALVESLRVLEEAAKTDTLENKGEGIKEPVKEPERGPEDAKGGDTGPKQQDVVSTGDRVKHLQHRLATLGYEPGMVDGRFGAKTASAVREFQAHSMVKVDGIVGPTTSAALRTAPHPDEMRAAETEGIEQPPTTAMPEAPAEPVGDAVTPDGGQIEEPAEEPTTPQEKPKSKSPTSGAMYKGVGVGQKSGDKGVRALQSELGHHGYTVATDGVFGPETHKTVKKFQRKWGLNPDGIAGPKTKQALAHVAKKRKSLAEAVDARRSATSGREQARALARERVLREQLQEGFNVAALVADALDKNPEFTAALADRLRDDDAVALLEGVLKRGENAIEVHRMPNGMFAPRGQGQVLNPGAKVLVPHKAGKSEPVTGVVGKAAAAIKLTSGPDVGKSVAIHPDYAGGKVPVTDLNVGDHFEHAGEHHAVIGKDEDGYVEAQSQVGDDETVKKYGGGQSVKPIAKPDYSKKTAGAPPEPKPGTPEFKAAQDRHAKAHEERYGKPDAGSGDLGPKFLKNLHALQPGDSINQGGYKIEWLPPLHANPNAIGDINPGAMGSPGVFRLTDSHGQVFSRHEPEDVAAFLGGTEAPPPGVKGKGSLGTSGPDAAPEPGGMGPNKANHSLKDMPLGTTFEMNDGSQWKLHKPVNDPYMIIKPLDGGKAKPMHKMMAPPKVGPVAPGYESGVPSPPPMAAPVMPGAPAPGVPGSGGVPAPGAPAPGGAPVPGGVPSPAAMPGQAPAPGTGGAGDDLFGKLAASVDMAKQAQAQGASPAAAFKGMSAQQQVQQVAKTPESAALEAYKAAGGNDPAVIAALSKQLQECLDATVLDLQEDWAEWNRKRKLGLVGVGRTLRHAFGVQDPGDNAGGADPAVGFRAALRKLKEGGVMRVPLPEGELAVAHTGGSGPLRAFHVTGGGAHVDPTLRRGPRNAVGVPTAAREAAERVMHTVHADFAHTAHHTGRVLAAKEGEPTRVQAVTGESGTITKAKDGFKVVHDAMGKDESQTHRTADGAVRLLKKGLRAKGARFLDEGHDTDPLSTMGSSRLEKDALQRKLRDPDIAERLKKRVEEINPDGAAGDLLPELAGGAMKLSPLTAASAHTVERMFASGGEHEARAASIAAHLAPHAHHIVHVHHLATLMQARVERETAEVRRLEEAGPTRDLVRARARLRALRARASA